MLLIIRIRLNDFDQIESTDVLIHTLIFQLSNYSSAFRCLWRFMISPIHIYIYKYSPYKINAILFVCLHSFETIKSHLQNHKIQFIIIIFQILKLSRKAFFFQPFLRCKYVLCLFIFQSFRSFIVQPIWIFHISRSIYSKIHLQRVELFLIVSYPSDLYFNSFLPRFDNSNSMQISRPIQPQSRMLLSFIKVDISFLRQMILVLLIQNVYNRGI